MNQTRRAAPARGLSVAVTADRPERAASGLAVWLTAAAPRAAKGIVEIALVSDRRMRALNRRFRAVDHATDVLSFPSTPDDSRRGRVSAATGSRPSKPLSAKHLGDIAIARGVANRQARAQGHSRRTELRVLALHGLLHLLGYDHEHDQGEMRRLEERLRRRAGLREGLISRARP